MIIISPKLPGLTPAAAPRSLRARRAGGRSGPSRTGTAGRGCWAGTDSRSRWPGPCRFLRSCTGWSRTRWSPHHTWTLFRAEPLRGWRSSGRREVRHGVTCVSRWADAAVTVDAVLALPVLTGAVGAVVLVDLTVQTWTEKRCGWRCGEGVKAVMLVHHQGAPHYKQLPDHRREKRRNLQEEKNAANLDEKTRKETRGHPRGLEGAERG